MSPRPEPPSDDAAQREAARERVSAWRRYHDLRPVAGPPLTPQDAIAAATWLYDLLPASSRARAVDPSGIARLRACLAVLRAR